MASQTVQASEAEDRKLSIQTLLIASVSSAAAAIIVSQFWKSGTAPAAAITPVVVTVLAELLHKPTEVVKRKVTAERTAILPEGAGAGAPAQKVQATVGGTAQDSEAAKPASEERPPPLHDDDGDAVPSDSRETREAPISYHKAGGNGGPPGTGKRRFPVKIVAITAALAFLIGAAILTVPELVAGGPVGKSSGGTTIFGGDPNANDTSDEAQDESSESQDGQSQDSQQQKDSSEQNQSKSESQSESQRKNTETTEQKSTPKTTPQQQQKAPATPQQPSGQR